MPWDAVDEPPRTPLYVPGGSGTFPVWSHITAPLNATPANPNGQFEAPYAVDWRNKPLAQLPFVYSVRDQILPWAIKVPQGDGSIKSCPAFVVNPPNPKLFCADGSPATLPIVVLAADADGDGIADSGLIRLGGGQVEGATYYGAVRIIDNAAALNVSTAMGMNLWPAPGKTVPGDLFPSNMDLPSLITGDDLSQLNSYRFNNNMGNFATAIDDTGVAHTDFAFGTPSEALWTQLGSRIGNPGYIANSGASGSTAKYQALPITEQMNLAYHFCLSNPAVVASSPALLEKYLPNSVLGPRSNRVPYSPAELGTWFVDQFYYNPGVRDSADGTKISMNENTGLRSCLVVRNPVSNFVPSLFNDRGFYGSPVNGAGDYAFGDRVQFTDPYINQVRGFVCIQPHAIGSQAPMNGNAYNNAYWAAMPWASHPTKINANTGTFGQLWTAYWSVMQDSPDANGNYPGGTVAQVDTDPGSNPPTNNLTHQFRSPIRSADAPALTRSQVIQLRSALAAVNTIDMRDGDTDITSRTIALTDAGGHSLYANVYGAERQPYFTSLLIDYEPTNSNPDAPYVVVELYNPQPVPIRMTGWKLAALVRSNGRITLKEVSDLTTTLQSYTTGRGMGGNATLSCPGDVILPGERIVLQNDPGLQPPNIKADWASNKVTSYVNKSTAGANLDAAVGNELVLLRPRVTPMTSASAVIGVNTMPENTYDEHNLIDLVPLDNLDLAGVGPSNVQPPVSQRFRYSRANKLWADIPPQLNSSYPSGFPGTAWHCVYPGPYNFGSANSAGFPYHHAGLVQVLATDNRDPAPPALADNGNFGRPIGAFQGAPAPTTGNVAMPNGTMLSADATYETRALKIACLDQAGPNRSYTEATTGGAPNGGVTPASGGAMGFPLGGFPRRGDLLEIPFIGSYVISTTPDPSARGAVVYEMNGITTDSVLAQFQSPAANTPITSAYDRDTIYANFFYRPPPPPNRSDPYYQMYSDMLFHNEQIGHFCPMSVNNLPGVTGSDFTDDPTDSNYPQYTKAWTYHWAKRIFDYLDVFTPQDAYLPNVDPAVTSAGLSGDPSSHGSSVKYPGATATPLPVPISSSPFLPVKQLSGQALVQQLQGMQDTASSEGQININTAEWRVLSAIPFYTPDIDPVYGYDNAQMAAAICQWRDSSNSNTKNPYAGYGPYRSIFDIMNISGGLGYTAMSTTIWAIDQEIWGLGPVYFGGDQFGLTTFSPGEANNEDGNLSPFAPTYSGIRTSLGRQTPVYSPPSASGHPVPNPLWTECDFTDHVLGDVKSRFLGFTRISNLITTRSDSFTVYAQVQAWQNIGTPTPTLVASKRAAMLFDRSQVKPLRNSATHTVNLTPPGVTSVPND
jgi:hypothetical protein